MNLTHLLFGSALFQYMYIIFPYAGKMSMAVGQMFIGAVVFFAQQNVGGKDALCAGQEPKI